MCQVKNIESAYQELMAHGRIAAAAGIIAAAACFTLMLVRYLISYFRIVV